MWWPYSLSMVAVIVLKLEQEIKQPAMSCMVSYFSGLLKSSLDPFSCDFSVRR